MGLSAAMHENRSSQSGCHCGPERWIGANARYSTADIEWLANRFRQIGDS